MGATRRGGEADIRKFGLSPPPMRSWPSIRPYAAAVLAVGLTFALKGPVEPALGIGPPLLLVSPGGDLRRLARGAGPRSPGGRRWARRSGCSSIAPRSARSSWTTPAIGCDSSSSWRKGCCSAGRWRSCTRPGGDPRRSPARRGATRRSWAGARPGCWRSWTTRRRPSSSRTSRAATSWPTAGWRCSAARPAASSWAGRPRTSSPPRPRSGSGRTIGRSSSEGRPTESEEVLDGEGGPHTYLTVKFPLRDADGAIYAVGGIATDITGRKQAEQALKASEQRFRTLCQPLADRHLPDGPEGPDTPTPTRAARRSSGSARRRRWARGGRGSSTPRTATRVLEQWQRVARGRRRVRHGVPGDGPGRGGPLGPRPRRPPALGTRRGDRPRRDGGGHHRSQGGRAGLAARARLRRGADRHGAGDRAGPRRPRASRPRQPVPGAGDRPPPGGGAGRGLVRRVGPAGRPLPGPRGDAPRPRRRVRRAGRLSGPGRRRPPLPGRVGQPGHRRARRRGLRAGDRPRPHGAGGGAAAGAAGRAPGGHRRDGRRAEPREPQRAAPLPGLPGDARLRGRGPPGGAPAHRPAPGGAGRPGPRLRGRADLCGADRAATCAPATSRRSGGRPGRNWRPRGRAGPTSCTRTSAASTRVAPPTRSGWGRSSATSSTTP